MASIAISYFLSLTALHMQDSIGALLQSQKMKTKGRNE
jgi:hypothetical protein